MSGQVRTRTGESGRWQQRQSLEAEDVGLGAVDEEEGRAGKDRREVDGRGVVGERRLGARQVDVDGAGGVGGDDGLLGAGDDSLGDASVDWEEHGKRIVASVSGLSDLTKPGGRVGRDALKWAKPSICASPLMVNLTAAPGAMSPSMVAPRGVPGAMPSDAPRSQPET